ncbi:site-specific integrase [Neobacillus drentensis]|uniref:site-specific integrase n=1 Tax=Neobacillus drentensis TaxID=220684 RepID=UPI002856419B|nr:site-specific integrase [Neobacillus drentensis]MDR7237304.1 integrase [Neobacillus drentensis]
MKFKIDQKTGTYYFVISAGFYPNGKRRQIKRSGFKNEKEAEKEYIAVKNEIQQETFVDPSNTTFGDFLEKWKEQKKSKVEESTFIRYERLCRLQIIPALGRMKLQKVSTRIVQDFIDTLVSEIGFKRKTCLLVTTILRDVFRFAIKKELVKVNPVQDIDLPKPNEAKIVIWDREDINVFLSIRHKKHRGKYYSAILMALLTGMRKGEILGLSWDKVDLKNGIIYVEQILESDGSRLSNKTKSKKFRQVFIPKMIKHELMIQRESQKNVPFNPHNLVFCTSRGKRVIPNTLNDVLDKYCSNLGLPRMKFHDLRHTHATLMITENVNIKIVQERLGHSKSSTTLDIYTHILPSMQKIVVDKLDEMFDCDFYCDSIELMAAGSLSK